MTMPPWLRKLGRWVGYPLFFLFWLLLFSYWTFPYDRLRDYLVQLVETEPVGRGAAVGADGPTLLGALLVALAGATLGALLGVGLGYAGGRREGLWRKAVATALVLAVAPIPLYLLWPREHPEVRRRPTGYQLEIGSLRPSWFTGVDAEDVRFAIVPDAPDERPRDLHIQSLHARLALLPLLAKTVALSFEARVARGDIEGAVAVQEHRQEIDAKFSGVRLRYLPILRAALPLPVEGTLDGELDLALDDDPALTEGDIDLRLGNVAVGDGSAKLALDGMGDGITVERINAGNLVLQARIEEGTATIERLQGRGDDLELDGEGQIRLRSPLRASQLDLLIRAKFSEGYQQRNDRTRALFSLLDLNPRARAAKTPDGALQYRIGGTIGGRISTQAAGRAPAPGSGGGDSSTR